MSAKRFWLIKRVQFESYWAVQSKWQDWMSVAVLTPTMLYDKHTYPIVLQIYNGKIIKVYRNSSGLHQRGQASPITVDD